MSSYFTKKDFAIYEYSAIKCYCGTKITVVPNIKAMSKAIEDHVEKHRQKIKNQKAAETEANRICDDLIAQMFEASR